MSQHNDQRYPIDAPLDSEEVGFVGASNEDLATRSDTLSSSPGNDAVTTHLPVVSEATAHPFVPRLPTGAMIDAKNTLQSFAGEKQSPYPAAQDRQCADAQDSDTPSSLVAVASASPTEPRLPTGAVINAKNTMQSFVRTDATPPPAEANVVPNPPPTAAQNEDAPSTVVAVAVAADPSVLYAEVEPIPEISWYQRRMILSILLILALLAAAGMGVYVGTSSGNKDSASDSTVNVDAPNGEEKFENARTSVLTFFINDISNSSLYIAPDGTIPASRALAWMIANDTTVLDTATLASLDSDALSRSAVGFRIRQRYPLLAMWFQQEMYGAWAKTDNWLQDLNECTWYGIYCDTRLDTVSGVNQNAVTRIFFNGTSSYVGVLPLDIGLLSNLQHFEIRDTPDTLQGSLPDSIGQWTALTYFNVYNNVLRGTLPASIGQWTFLSLFDVSLNVYLSGPLPDSIGQWTALTYFDVSSGQLTGTLPDSIGQWTALTFFDASINALTGPLPDSIGQWTALTSFSVSGNILNGTLPDSIGQWTALTYFDVGGNSLNGTLPDSIGQWNVLTSFDVDDNALTGTIPSSIENWALIESADFSCNSLVGILPNAICQYIDQDTDYLAASVQNCTCCTNDVLACSDGTIHNISSVLSVPGT